MIHVFVLLMASLNIVIDILSFNFVNLFILITGVAGAEAAQWDLSSRESHQYLDNVQPTSSSTLSQTNFRLPASLLYLSLYLYWRENLKNVERFIHTLPNNPNIINCEY